MMPNLFGQDRQPMPPAVHYPLLEILLTEANLGRHPSIRLRF